MENFTQEEKVLLEKNPTIQAVLSGKQVLLLQLFGFVVNKLHIMSYKSQFMDEKILLYNTGIIGDCYGICFWELQLFYKAA